MIPFKEWHSSTAHGGRRSSTGQSRDRRIAAFNKITRETEHPGKTNIATTFNYRGKVISSVPPVSLSHLKPIFIEELQVDTTHRQRVLFARIVSQVMRMASIMVLVEDQEGGSIADLALYGLPDASVVKENRCLAIIEPHYKIRQDGSLGIRVDTPDDIVWDATAESMVQKEDTENPELMAVSDNSRCETVTLERRLQQIFMSDPNLGVDKAFRKVTNEGFDATKQQIRALRKTITENKGTGSENTEPEPLAPILSEQ